MKTARLLAFLLAVLFATGTLAGQDKPAKPGDPPKEEPKKDEPKKDDPKKDEPAGKVKGQLPQNWGKLGLTEDQKQKVYKVNATYGDKIDKLKAEIEELEAKRDKERLDVLTPDQKKKLEDILKEKAGGKG